MTTYAIDTGDGDLLAAGLPEHTAYRTAQRLADERGEELVLYAEQRPDDEVPDDQRSRTVEPTAIVVDLDAPSGPRVTYGAQDEATVEIEVPHGWVVDWSNAVNLAPSGHHRIAYAAPLVQGCECGVVMGYTCVALGPFVTLEWMPLHLRASHDAAGNRGVFPHNGADRLRVTAECAQAIIEDKDHAGWATLVESP